MRKKLLALENAELKYTMERQTSELKLLKKKIDELNILIGAKDSEIKDLKAELSNGAIEEPPKEVITEVKILPPPEQNESAVKTLDDDVLLNNINKYGADTIAKAALKTAEFIENAKKSLGEENATDAATLALGKNEMFKSKVFEVANSAVSYDAAKSSIDVLYAELNEYIEHLKSQN